MAFVINTPHGKNPREDELKIRTVVMQNRIQVSSISEPDISPLALGLFGLSAVLLIGFAIYNLVLLASRGQTIGKKLMSIRIVTHPEGANPGGVKTILLRVFVNGLISAVPVLGSIYAIVDICFIFREDRRCIHDLIAGTQVVQGQPPGF